jgi:hypothetical protein
VFRHALDFVGALPGHERVSPGAGHPPPRGLQAEGKQHLMVPHPLAALDQPEITDDAVRSAAHAGELRTLKMIAHTRQHRCSMHRAPIQSTLTAAESTSPIREP